MVQTGDNKAAQFLIQKIAIDVQRGNAASVMVTISIVTGLGRVYFFAIGIMINVDLQVMTSMQWLLMMLIV